MKIKEYDKYVIILGFKDVSVSNMKEFLEMLRIEVSPIAVQLFKADHVAGIPHLFFAALNALKAFEQGSNISRKLEMELLLYASGQRQIDKAIEMLGVSPKISEIALVMIALSKKEADTAIKNAEKCIPGIRDDSVLEIQGEDKVKGLMERFGVTNLELETMMENEIDRRRVLMWLVIEHNTLFPIKH